MQPLYEVAVTRSWHWGIAVIVDQRGDVPDVVPNQFASVGDSGLVLLVRHAQDGLESYDDELDWATATLHVRSLIEPEPTSRLGACDVVIKTSSGLLSVGDADWDLVFGAHRGRTRLRVSVDDTAESVPGEVWIDLIPGEL